MKAKLILGTLPLAFVVGLSACQMPTVPPVEEWPVGRQIHHVAATPLKPSFDWFYVSSEEECANTRSGFTISAGRSGPNGELVCSDEG